MRNITETLTNQKNTSNLKFKRSDIIDGLFNLKNEKKLSVKSIELDTDTEDEAVLYIEMANYSYEVNVSIYDDDTVTISGVLSKLGNGELNELIEYDLSNQQIGEFELDYKPEEPVEDIIEEVTAQFLDKDVLQAIAFINKVYKNLLKLSEEADEFDSIINTNLLLKDLFVEFADRMDY